MPIDESIIAQRKNRSSELEILENKAGALLLEVWRWQHLLPHP